MFVIRQCSTSMSEPRRCVILVFVVHVVDVSQIAKVFFHFVLPRGEGLFVHCPLLLPTVGLFFLRSIFISLGSFPSTVRDRFVPALDPLTDLRLFFLFSCYRFPALSLFPQSPQIRSQPNGLRAADTVLVRRTNISWRRIVIGACTTGTVLFYGSI